MTLKERIETLEQLIDKTEDRAERKRYIASLDKLLAAQNAKGSLLRHAAPHAHNFPPDGL
jgi:hypothetical protein